MVTILELTVPWNSTSSISNGRNRKQNKAYYQFLASDLHQHGFRVQLLTIEIGCLAIGHYMDQAYMLASSVLLQSPHLKTDEWSWREHQRQQSPGAILFRARSIPQWSLYITVHLSSLFIFLSFFFFFLPCQGFVQSTVSEAPFCIHIIIYHYYTIYLC